jgi:hypothetical protein
MNDTNKSSSKEARILAAKIMGKMSEKYNEPCMKEAAEELKENVKNMESKK